VTLILNSYSPVDGTHSEKPHPPRRKPKHSPMGEESWRGAQENPFGVVPGCPNTLDQVSGVKAMPGLGSRKWHTSG